MSDATKHMANQILYRLNAKVSSAAHPHMDAAPKVFAPKTRLPKHVLDHAIDYIDKIKTAKRVIK